MNIYYMTIVVVVLVQCVVLVRSDVYLQVMSGSNNRLDEANRERANGNRLFDSQNNNRGGYNVQALRYMPGSELDIKWTNQHACGNSKMHCQIVIQFMCNDWLRDGTSTQRIPLTEEADRDLEYGRHESYAWYRNCQMRERNQGLFTASQQLQKDRAQFTRQNPNGNRRGFECPEERDYYPYWGPSPWMDIAILTDQMEQCSLYKRESHNVKEKYACEVNTTQTRGFIPITQRGCEGLGGIWQKVKAHGIPAPECLEAPWTRENHLGLTHGGDQATYKWTIPDLEEWGIESDRCALRIRYNISTADYDGWSPLVNGTLNDREGEKLNLTAFYDASTPYLFKNNPTVEYLGATLELAVNTAQYGRTFQDRSHRFQILDKWEDQPPGTKIHNLNVQGKRGNIVQVFPATEYFYSPENLKVRQGDYVHVQWSGSNTNPNNNDGQGQQGTDRTNLMQIRDMGRTYPIYVNESTFWNRTSLANRISYFAHDHHGHASKSDPGQLGGEMSELDDAGTYQDNGLYRVTGDENSEHAMMCSRNNNFSNRGQKVNLRIEPNDDDDTPTHIVVGAVASALIGTALLIAGSFALYQHYHTAVPAASSSAPVAASSSPAATAASPTPPPTSAPQPPAGYVAMNV